MRVKRKNRGYKCGRTRLSRTERTDQAVRQRKDKRMSRSALFIASGMREGEIEIHGTPATLSARILRGASITVYGNAQDAVGDTMNDGRIIVHGGIGDAAGYAMRGGEIIVRGDAGYRVGIHMKEYREKCPAIVIGGVWAAFSANIRRAAE